MRLFADQDVYAITLTFLESLGHDVQTASKAGLSRARDEDFGNLVVAQGLPCRGVILIRSVPARIVQAHRQLQAALLSLTNLEGIFVVVEQARYRVRRLAQDQGPADPVPTDPDPP